MANDAVALLDALNLPSAHLVAASMGGLISQLIAIRYPQRALSLTSIMSTTGNTRLPKPDAETLQQLTTRPSDPLEENALMTGFSAP